MEKIIQIDRTTFKCLKCNRTFSPILKENGGKFPKNSRKCPVCSKA